MTDEELQKKLEMDVEGAGDSLDERAYREVFTALKRETFQLHPDFALKLLNRFENSRTSDSKDMMWMAAGIFLCLIAFIVAIVLTDFQLSLPGFNFLKSYPGLLIFASAFILTLQWLDKKFIKKSLHMH